MREASQTVWHNERGVMTVQWVALGGMVLALVIVVYAVLHRSDTLRAALTRTVAFYAVHFGDGITAAGPRLPCRNDRDKPREPCIEPYRIAPIHTVLNPSKQLFTLYSPTNRSDVAVQPAAGVQATLDPTTGIIVLTRPTDQRQTAIDPARGVAVLINDITGEQTAIDVVALIEMRLVVRATQPSRAIPSITRPTLGIPMIMR